MIQKIDISEVDELGNDGAGMYCELGFIEGTTGQIVIEGKAGWFLASSDHFKREGLFGGPNPELILAIGGLLETEQEKLAKELNISFECAADIQYFRTRTRWSQDLENELIRMHKEGKSPNMNEFGCTAETGAKLYWNAARRSRLKRK